MTGGSFLNADFLGDFYLASGPDALTFEDVASYLLDLTKNYKCPFCGCDNFNVLTPTPMDENSDHPAIPLSSTQAVSTRKHPVFMMNCDGCGHISMFSLDQTIARMRKFRSGELR